MRKKRILMCAESHKVNSGFGRYTQEILSRLHKNPNYEIAELSCYASKNNEPIPPWKVYPVAVDNDHADYTTYNSNPLNQFGQWRFDKAVLHFRPDIVFDIRDYWMFSYQELSPLKKYFHWVIAPTIDSVPQRHEWLNTFENADVLLTHTDWAGDYIKSLNRNINLQGCVADSVDHEVFKPVSWTKNFHKAKYGLPSNSIIIGSVMRNQKRKLIAELFRSLRQLIDTTQNENIFLYLHTSYPEAQGWNIPELLQEYGVYNNVLFTYYSPTSKNIFVSAYKGPKMQSPNEEGLSVFPNVVNGLTNDQLVEVYNLFDIYVQYAICEGLGIPQLEAAACGVPIFAVNYSGMEEITTKVNGVKIKYLLAKELETSSDRATPDNDHLVSEIIKWIKKSPQEKKLLSQQTRQLLIQHYSWDKTAEYLMRVFDALEPKNIWHEPMTTNTSLQVPEGLSPRVLLYYIVDNILMEPKLKKTYFIESLIRSLDESFTTQNNKIISADTSGIVKSMEIYLNNKIFAENIRNGSTQLTDEFLNQ